MLECCLYVFIDIHDDIVLKHTNTAAQLHYIQTSSVKVEIEIIWIKNVKRNNNNNKKYNNTFCFHLPLSHKWELGHPFRHHQLAFKASNIERQDIFQCRNAAQGHII